jgi:hypothetical protein
LTLSARVAQLGSQAMTLSPTEKAQRAQTAGAVALVVIDGPRIEIEGTSTLTCLGVTHLSEAS